MGPASVRGAYEGPAEGYAQIVDVPVEFTLTFAHPLSIPNGRNAWSYILVRNHDRDPWLIADEGMG